MALTSQVKEELSSLNIPQGMLRAAELSSIIRFGGGLHRISGRVVIEIELDSPRLVHRTRKALAELYGAPSQVNTAGQPQPGQPGAYLVRIPKGGEILARQTGLIDSRNRAVRGLPAPLVSGSIEVAYAVWRGAFLAAGTLSDPGRSAALEIQCPGNEAAMALVGSARRLGITAKAREVRGTSRVVIRDADQISQMLGFMGAKTAVHDWEEIKHRKEVRASVNRLVNFDDANLRRSAQAAVAAGARVERALEILGDQVPEHLRYAGELRVTYKQASLDELGRLADPPMTKDAIAGRIRRLLAMADKSARDRGIPSTEANLPEDLEELP